MAAPAGLGFGQHRIRAGWIGIGIAAAAFTVIAASQVAIGDWRVLLAVGPILLAFGLACAVTRTVAIDPAAGRVSVERRLLGLSWRRHWALSRFDRVAITWHWAQSKHARSDGTLLGDQRFMHYAVALDGRSRVLLETIFHDAAAAERTALGVARALGLPAERRGYTREAAGARLAMRRKGGRERL